MPGMVAASMMCSMALGHPPASCRSVRSSTNSNVADLTTGFVAICVGGGSATAWGIGEEKRVVGHPELHEAKGRVVLSVHVQPGARVTEVVGRHGDALKVRVAAPATGGRANEAVLALVAEEFGLARRDVELVSGPSSRRKRILLGELTMVDAGREVDRLLTGQTD
jgi:uncharacterized protein (TIGR00251 family)